MLVLTDTYKKYQIKFYHIILFLILSYTGSQNLDFFLTSQDFSANITYINSDSDYFSIKLMYSFLKYLSIITSPETTLIMFWSAGVTILSYIVIKIVRNIFKNYLPKLNQRILITFFVFFLMMKITAGFFGLIPGYDYKYIATAHLLFQTVACSLVLLLFLSVNFKWPLILLLIIISFIIHPITILYYMLYCISIIIVDRIQKTGNILFFFIPLFIFVFLPHYIISSYKIYLNNDIDFDTDILLMGIDNKSYTWFYFILTLITLVLIKFRKIHFKKSFIGFSKKIIYFFYFSFYLSLLSLIIDYEIVGLGYRIAYIVYISLPIFIIYYYSIIVSLKKFSEHKLIKSISKL